MSALGTGRPQCAHAVSVAEVDVADAAVDAVAVDAEASATRRVLMLIAMIALLRRRRVHVGRHAGHAVSRCRGCGGAGQCHTGKVGGVRG